MAAPAPARLRILCLHGFVQNGEVFRSRTGSLRKAVKALADFVFIDGPHSAAGAFGADPEAFDADGKGGPPLGWWTAAENGGGGGGSGGEGEWVRPSASRQAVGVEESLDLIEAAWKDQGPFDGILGFSQGAAVAALFLALRRPAGARFAILVGGFLPHDEAWAARARGAAPLNADALVVAGEADLLVEVERSRALLPLFADGRGTLYLHAGGHGLPSNAEWRAAAKAFLARQLQ